MKAVADNTQEINWQAKYLEQIDARLADIMACLKAAEAADAERRFLEALTRIHADVARDGLTPDVAEEAVRESAPKAPGWRS